MKREGRRSQADVRLAGRGDPKKHPELSQVADYVKIHGCHFISKSRN